MELLEGQSLASRLVRGALPVQEALKRAIEIADALSAAHRLGIVHRDLKPANVMLTATGAKLLDFGVAVVPPAGGSINVPTETGSLTEEGAIVGRLPYMAPEQLEAQSVDSRTDIFAFGAVLYEMLTGRRAFTGDSRASVMAAILKEHPSPVMGAAIDVPIGLDRVVRKCLAKDPDERWQTARDLRDELIWIAETAVAPASSKLALVRHRRAHAWRGPPPPQRSLA
jgi:serine/threonine protein kinase